MTKNGMLSRFGSGKARAATRDGQNATGARANAPIGRVGARGVRAAIIAGAVSLGLLVPAAALADGEGAPVQPKPVSTAAPTLSGTPAPGQTLTCSTGTWSNNPTSYAYAWLRDGVAIGGQTGSAYLVQSADQGHSISCQVTATNSGGEYTIEGLPSGSYAVSFEPNEGNFLRQFYNGKVLSTEATPVSVTVPNATSGIDSTLAAGGEISGRVVAAVGGAPLEGIFACAYSEHDESCAATNANGEYTIMGLDTGGYEVWFAAFDCYFEGCTQRNLVSQAYASEVGVTAGTAVNGINVELAPGGEIHGRVTFEGKPEAGVEACALPAYRCTYTDANGDYAIVGMSNGEYELHFRPRAGSEAASIVHASKVDVEVGTPSEINEPLPRGGKISGTVLAESNSAPLSEVEVCAYGAQDDCVFSETDGKYLIQGLPSGTYGVEFYPNPCSEGLCGSRRNYQQGSVSVAVTAPNTAAVAPVKLATGGEISGKVSAASGGAPLSEVEVCAWEQTRGYEECAYTNSNGEYTIQGLAESTGAGYDVTFQYYGSGGYLSEYYGGSTPTLVELALPNTVSNVNGALASGGQITGNVNAGGPVPSMWVCAAGIKLEYEFGSEWCVESNVGGGSTSAGSNALAVPAPVSTFEEKGKAKFNPKTGELEFVFEVSNPGTFEWSLDFQNADVGFADSLGISAGHVSGAADAVAIAAGKHGKHHGAHKKRHSVKCKKGEVKHKGKCVHKLVPFATGKQSVSTPGKVTIAVKPDAQAVKALDKGDTLHVTGEFTFSSALGGTPTTVDVKAVTHGKKPKHKKHHGKGKKHQHHKKH